MGLTNVWRKLSSGEWVRTSEAEARRIFPYTVSARDERLRCNICYQYVTFIAIPRNVATAALLTKVV